MIVPYHNINSLWSCYKGKLMKQKVIVADDSLTIQKVIKITLANENFELVECLSDETLFDVVESEKPVLALLDFNLSENKTGYDLAKELRAKGVSKILMLYGTFDTIDEALLDASGVGNYIVKPFEGTKFITQCRQMVEEVNLEQSSAELETVNEVLEDSSLESEPEIESDFDDDFDEIDIEINDDDEPSEEDQWVVNQPNIIEDEKEDEIVSASEPFESEISNDELNSLEAGMKDWGIDIPGVISEKLVKEEIELPPVINEINTSLDSDKTSEFVFSELTQEKSEPLEEESTEHTLPENNDLEYPDMSTIRESVALEAPVSKLVSIDELSLEDDDASKEYDLDDTLGTKTDDEIRHLEAQIDEDDLIEEESSADLWAADEVINTEPEQASVDESSEVLNENHLQDISDDLQSINNTIEEEVIAPAAAAVSDIKLDESQILEYLEPVISKIVDARVEAILERIAWEVIPDLAENLIRKELKEISKGITRS